jgi:outer membrane protein TolC
VHSAEQLVRSVGRSYQAGVRTTVDVLNAEQQLAEARRNLAQTRLTTLLALLKLRSLGGLIGEADIEQLDAYLAPVVGASARS